jgi:pyrimidine-nucleoside phosphorylase
VLDVKFGSGAFMKTQKEAEQLAAAMTEVGELMGVKVAHLLSPMDEPLGRAVGNALEVIECVEVLQGGGPEDVVNLVLDLAEKVSTVKRPQLATWLKDGTAWKKFISLVYAQDGDASSLEKLSEIHRAPLIQPLAAKSAGTVKKMDAETIGRASLLLGGGRKTADDAIDFAVGLSGIRKIGERVEKGEPLLQVHARSEQGLRMVQPLLEKAVELER